MTGTYWRRLLLGLGIGALGLGLQLLLWPEGILYPYPYLMRTPWVILGALLGGGVTGGGSATLIIALGSLTFTHLPLAGREALLLSELLFVCTGLGISWITELSRKREEALRRTSAELEEKERLKFAALAADLGIWEWDLASQRINWDEGMFRLFGCDPSTFTGDFDFWRRSVHPEDLVATEKTLTDALESGGRTFVAEYRVRRGDGSERRLIGHGLVLRNSQGHPLRVFGLNRDITNETQTLDELKRARSLAEAASKAKSRFLDIAAHELRTPVTAASLLLEVLDRQLIRDQCVDPQSLRRVRGQMERLSRLVTDLLEVSRLERGLITLKLEPIDFGTLIEDMIQNFRLSYPDRLFRWTAPASPIVANADAVRVEEILGNLLDNALKYSEDPAPIEVGLHASDESVTLFVQDHGPGVAEERKAALFQAFERGTSPLENRHPGLGLGLFISKNLTELHGGRILVGSTPGFGTRFSIELPRNPARKDPTTRAAA